MINSFLFDSLIIDDYDKFVENLYNFSTLINSTNIFGETLLHFVCFYGMIDKYYALINFGANFKATNLNNNLLHYACFSGNDDFLIVELVKYNINPIELNNLNETALHLCSNERICHYLYLWTQRNKIEILNLLDIEGNTVLHTAFQYGFEKSVNYWLKSHPTLALKKNKHGYLWNEIPKKEKDFCKGY